MAKEYEKYGVQQVTYMAESIILKAFKSKKRAEKHKEELEEKHGGMDIYSYYEVVGVE